MSPLTERRNTLASPVPLVRPSRRRRATRSLGISLVAATVLPCLAASMASAMPTPAYDPVLSYIAGSGTRGTVGGTPMTGAASSVDLVYPGAIVSDSAGNIYFGESAGNRVGRIDASTGNVTTVIGTGANTDPSPGAAAGQPIANPSGLARRGSDLFVVSINAKRVYKIDASGQLSVFAGDGNAPATGAAPTGLATATSLRFPTKMAFDSAGNAYVSDTSGQRIVKIDTSGQLTNLLGDGTAGVLVPGPVAASRTSSPGDVVVDANDNLYFTEYGSDRVAKIVLSTGQLSIIAGNGTQATAVPGPAVSSPLFDPAAITVDAQGNVYVSDRNNGSSQVLRVSTTGMLTRIAGSPTNAAGTSTPGLASSSSLEGVRGLSIDNSGHLLLTEGVGSRIDRITLPYSTLPTITSAAPTAATAGSAFSARLAASGNASTWSVPLNNLPSWLTLNSSTGVLSGSVPSTLGAQPTFTVRATNASGYDEQTITLNVSAPPSGGGSIGGGAGLGVQTITTAAPKTLPLNTRTVAINATASAAGKLTYTSATPSICSVDAAGVVTALKAGVCSVKVDAAASTTGAATSTTVSVSVAASAAASLPAGPQRLAGNDRVATSSATAEKVFPTPAAGTSYDVVVTTAGFYADSLAGARLAGQVGGPLLLTDGRTLSESTADQLKRLVAKGGTIHLLGGKNAVSEDVEKSIDALIDGDTVVRVAGDDRYETAAAIADATVKRSGDVGPIYLVTARDFADGVSVGAYAQSTGGVVLLTDGDKMPEATATYLKLHDPKGDRAIAIGGPAKNAAATAGLLGAVERAIVGADRFDTSAKLAAELKAAADKNGIKVTSVGMAGGSSWPDALSGSAAMAALGGPLLLTPTGADSVPAVTTEAVAKTAAERLVAFGGEKVITGKAYEAIGANLAK